MARTYEPKKTTNGNTINTHKLFRKDECISVSITPAQKGQYLQDFNHAKSDALSQFNERLTRFYSNWSEVFRKRLSPLCDDYIFCIEISKYGNLHLHGTIKVKHPAAVASFIGYVKYKLGYNIDVDSIGSMENWNAYLTKDNEVMIGYDDNNQSTIKMFPLSKGILY